MSRILVIPDTQCRGDVDLDYMRWIGEYIVDKRPETIVQLGDFWDIPSLSSYDKGKLSFEGRRLKADIEAGLDGMDLLLNPLFDLQAKQKTDKKKVYNPRMVLTLGNHEYRLLRVSENNSEFAGFIDYDLLRLEDYGWEVHPFLKPVEISGIFFVHYLSNPFTGKPYGGNALNQLKTIGRSFVVGHKQTLDVAIRPTIDGKMQLGIIAGAAYPHDESYKGWQGNTHFRGIIMLNDVHDGYADACFVSLAYLEKRYG